ncbi:MAG: hypothetical protein FJ218_01545 [Ignavibacteria bacterium]|nr:hypothetical protein [Ignavibacteria bacterium]
MKHKLELTNTLIQKILFRTSPPASKELVQEFINKIPARIVSHQQFKNKNTSVLGNPFRRLPILRKKK